jgi:hypothetical protein
VSCDRKLGGKDITLTISTNPSPDSFPNDCQLRTRYRYQPLYSSCQTGLLGHRQLPYLKKHCLYCTVCPNQLVIENHSAENGVDWAPPSKQLPQNNRPTPSLNSVQTASEDGAPGLFVKPGKIGLKPVPQLREPRLYVVERIERGIARGHLAGNLVPNRSCSVSVAQISCCRHPMRMRF